MKIKAFRKQINYYEFDNEVIEEFKDYANEKDIDFNEENFLDYIYENYYIEEFESDYEFGDIEFIDFREND